MAKLILDTLYPPSPDQLIADLNAVGADGAAVYVWRPGGVGTWTPAHVRAMRAAGKICWPIVVPATDGGDINGQLGAAQAFGFTSGPISANLELPNLPDPAWEERFDAAAAAASFTDLDYGTRYNLGLYQPDDRDWIAEWIRTGVLEPLPTLPAGRAAWQFVNDIAINGHQYDASVVDLGGDLDMDPTLAAKLDEILNTLATGSDARAPGTWIATMLNNILAKVSQPQQPVQPVDVTALAAQLEPILAAALIPHLPPSVDSATVARMVVSDLAAQLQKP